MYSILVELIWSSSKLAFNGKFLRTKIHIKHVDTQVFKVSNGRNSSVTHPIGEGQVIMSYYQHFAFIYINIHLLRTHRFFSVTDINIHLQTIMYAVNIGV